MILTEDEAREKWCPFARSVRWERQDEKIDLPGSPVVANREPLGDEDGGCLCIASNCMSWRVSRFFDKPGGYCGLAGKPAEE